MEIFMNVIIAILLVAVVIIVIAGAVIVVRTAMDPARQTREAVKHFQDQLKKISERYAEEIGLIKFLEEAERTGGTIDAAQFAEGALNRANLLRIKRIEGAIADQETALVDLQNELREVMQEHAEIGGNRKDIKRIEEQIRLNEERNSKLFAQLLELRVFGAESWNAS